MKFLRIRTVQALEGFRLRLILTDGSTIERDVSALMTGPVFESMKRDPERFRMVRAEGGTVVWTNGADLCPDMLIWEGHRQNLRTDPPDPKPKEFRSAIKLALRLHAASISIRLTNWR